MQFLAWTINIHNTKYLKQKKYFIFNNIYPFYQYKNIENAKMKLINFIYLFLF